MKQLEVVCGNCKGVLSLSLEAPKTLVACPLCNMEISAYAFPALFSNMVHGAEPERVMVDDQSSCFFHPQNKAVVPCDHCGRFLCSLCDISDGAAHFCPACFSVTRSPENGERRVRVTRYDHVALSLAVLPLLAFPLTLVTAPVTLYIVIRHWNSRTGIIQPHRRATMLGAGVLALLQIAGWLLFIAMVSLGIAGGLGESWR